ncbi:MAG TPA: hypothetical protein VFJ14_12580 [Nocardioidaceae bacterium]|nr:hypothetical protein [Nocardioidaceae bacterium]
MQPDTEQPDTEQPDTVQLGPGRAPLRERLTDGHRRRLTLFVVFVVGAVVGSAVVSALSTGSSPHQPELHVNVADVSRFGNSEFTVDLRVRNEGPEQVHIERVSAETNGYALLYAAPRPPDGGPPLRVDPGSTGSVGLTLRPYCLSDGASNVTLLLVLAGDAGSGQTLALPVPDLDRRLGVEHRASCAISHRPGDYTVSMLASRIPAWSDGRQLVIAVRVSAHGELSHGLELAEVRPHLVGIVGHFLPGHGDGAVESLGEAGITGELWLRMRDCRRAAGLDWGRPWAAYSNGVGIELYVEKPASGSAVRVQRNGRLLSRIHRWVDAACAVR